MPATDLTAPRPREIRRSRDPGRRFGQNAPDRLKEPAGVGEQASMIVVRFATHLLIRLRHSEGQALMEYGMMIAMIALVVLAAAVLFGGQVAGVTTQNAAGV